MKKIKTRIIKFSAIAIGVVYLLIPIHQEIKSVLHSLSHSIEMSGYSQHHDHGDQPHLENEFSEDNKRHHEHEIINILDYFTDASEHHKESKKTNTSDLEVDKHFYTSKYSVLKLVSIVNPLADDVYKESKIDCFYQKINVPPKEI